MKGYIYAIKENCKIIYIGSTINPKDRFYEHLTEHRCKKMQPIHKYLRSIENKGISIDIIKTVDFNNRKQLNEIEFSYINKYNTVNNGFNIDDGKRCGKLNANARRVICTNNGKVFNTVKEACEHYGISITEMSSHLTKKRYLNGIGKRKVGELLLFEYIDRDNDSRNISNETRKLISERATKMNSKKVYCAYNGKTYNTLMEASIDLNVNYTTLSSYLNNNSNNKGIEKLNVIYI